MRRRRSVLFAPADSERKLRRALASGADVVVADLEDAVVAERAAAARGVVRTVLTEADGPGPERLLRVSRGAGGWEVADAALVAALAAADRLDGVMLPKVEGPRDLDAFLRAAGEDVALWPVATETAAGVVHLAGIAAHPAVTALCWGAEDLSAAIGAWGPRQDDGTLRPVFTAVRHQALLAAKASGRDVLDGVWAGLDDDDGLAGEARAAAAMGFSGKLAVHPRQVAVIHAAFAPPPGLVGWARRLLSARGDRPGEGTFRFEGRMVDRPHFLLAEQLLDRAADDEHDAGP